MTTTKRGHAINGDTFTLRHPLLDFAVPFTSFIDVSFRGVTHQVLSAADRNAFAYENVTGEFTVGEFAGHILEKLDTVDTQVSHRYQALVSTPTGVLSTHSYDSVSGLLALVGALRPVATPLGVTVDLEPDVEFTTAAKVALQTSTGVIEVTPLTNEVIDQLPTWEGSAVAGGQLYGGRFTDGSGYVTLVTESCRVLALPGADADEDTIAAHLAELHATWA